MTAPLIAGAVHGGALVLMLSALACACGAATARSLFAMCMYASAAAALIGATMLALGAGAAALGVALFGVGLAPVLVLAALLLSARAVKSGRRGMAWLTITAAVAAVGVIVWASPELSQARPALLAATASTQPAPLAFLFLAAFAAVIGVLGYGERGVLERAFEFGRRE